MSAGPLLAISARQRSACFSNAGTFASPQETVLPPSRRDRNSPISRRHCGAMSSALSISTPPLSTKSTSIRLTNDLTPAGARSPRGTSGECVRQLVGIAQPSTQRAKERGRDLRVLHDDDSHDGGVDLERLGVLCRGHGGRARSAVEQSHLTDHVTGSEL